MKNNEEKIEELYEQIKGWRREQENIEDMMEAAYLEIDKLRKEQENHPENEAA